MYNVCSCVCVCGWRGKNGRHGCTVNGFGATVVDVCVCMHVCTLCVYIYRGRSKTSLSQHQSQDTPPASATPATKYVCMSTSSHLIVRRLVSSASQGFACMRCSRQAGGLGSLIEAAIWGRRRDWAGAARIPARRVEGRACARVPLWSAARKPITYTDRERRARAMRRWNYIGDGEAIE